MALGNEGFDEVFDVECPCCGGEFPLRIEDVEKENIVCPLCNNILEIDLEYEE
jgi:hypothetical protein